MEFMVMRIELISSTSIWRNYRITRLFYWWVAVNCIDALLTTIGITLAGATETNPVLQYFPPPYMILFKMSVCLLVGIIAGRRTLIWGSGLVGLVCIWNIVNLVLL